MVMAMFFFSIRRVLLRNVAEQIEESSDEGGRWGRTYQHAHPWLLNVLLADSFLDFLALCCRHQEECNEIGWQATTRIGGAGKCSGCCHLFCILGIWSQHYSIIRGRRPRPSRRQGEKLRRKNKVCSKVPAFLIARTVQESWDLTDHVDATSRCLVWRGSVGNRQKENHESKRWQSRSKRKRRWWWW